MRFRILLFVPLLVAINLYGCSKGSSASSGSSPAPAESARSVQTAPPPSPIISADQKLLALQDVAMHSGDACREDNSHNTDDAKIIADCGKAITATMAIEDDQRNGGGANQADLDEISLMIAMELYGRGSAYAHSGNISAAKADYDQSQGRLQRVLKNKALAAQDLQGAQVMLRALDGMQQGLSEQR